MADINFGAFTDRHNFNFGSQQVQKIDLGDTQVWIHAIIGDITPSVTSRADTSVSIRLTFTGNDPGIISYGYYEGSTVASNKVTVADSQNINGSTTFTISGLTFGQSYTYLFWADNGTEGTALFTFETNNFAYTTSGSVSSGFSMPGNSSGYRASFPYVQNAPGAGGGGTSPNSANGTWSTTSVVTPPSVSPASHTFTAPGQTRNFAYSGGTLSSAQESSLSGWRFTGQMGSELSGATSLTATSGTIFTFTNRTSSAGNFNIYITGYRTEFGSSQSWSRGFVIGGVIPSGQGPENVSVPAGGSVDIQLRYAYSNSQPYRSWGRVQANFNGQSINSSDGIGNGILLTS